MARATSVGERLEQRRRCAYDEGMPAKQTTLTEDERRRRIREAARQVEASEDASDFEKVFKKVVETGPRKVDRPA